ncbi:MAG: ECF transporter S component [Clostridia bacterium]|nr:ECF transporter S component [Clostridia bacterium]
MNATKILKLVLSALLLAVGLVLPMLTGNIPQMGSMLLPMHLPVLLCGFVCGWKWGMAVGFILPILRSLLFSMPPMVPTALAMAFELAAYGAVSGLCYRLFAGKKGRVILSLVIAMVAGRLVWGLVSIPIYAMFTDKTFTLAAFWAGGFVNAWPGILLQMVLIPAIVLALEKAGLLPLKTNASPKGKGDHEGFTAA